MQNEDDLRGLAKVMEFMRAISILFVIILVYWYCYEAVQLWRIHIGVIDRILMNFNRTAGLFTSLLWTKIFVVVLPIKETRLSDVYNIQPTAQHENSHASDDSVAGGIFSILAPEP